MKSQDVVIFVATVLGGAAVVVGMVEECPSYCSPVNNNYGPACASISSEAGKIYWTFPNLCELYKQRCYNTRFGGTAIEFVSDGACASAVRKTNQCQVICSPENNKFGPVCASVGNSFRTYPNLCVMLREKCTNERTGQREIKYLKDGSCSIPVRNDGVERTPQETEPVVLIHRQKKEQLMEDRAKDDVQAIEEPRKQV